MRRILSERNLVVVLFVLVIITFSLAQEDTRKMERAFTGASSTASRSFVDLGANGTSTPSAITTVAPGDQIP